MLSILKKQDKDSSKKAPTARKKVRKSNAGAKDDETVSKLKAMAVACGVRKMWKKEFADLDPPSGQIKRLKEILKDLGMTGRLTLEKAKAIKAIKAERIRTGTQGCARFRRGEPQARDGERKGGIGG